MLYYGAFLSCVVDKMLSRCSYSKKPPLPWKIPSCTLAIILQSLIYWDIYIKLSVYGIIVIEDDLNWQKERKSPEIYLLKIF